MWGERHGTGHSLHHTVKLYWLGWLAGWLAGSSLFSLWWCCWWCSLSLSPPPTVSRLPSPSLSLSIFPPPTRLLSTLSLPLSLTLYRPTDSLLAPTFVSPPLSLSLFSPYHLPTVPISLSLSTVLQTLSGSLLLPFLSYFYSSLFQLFPFPTILLLVYMGH